MDPHERFFRSLTSEDEQLLIIRDILYDGLWNEVILDLKARQEGKPFVFKLSSRIEEDLGRIDRLSEYENEHGVDLGVYLRSSGKYPELADAFAVPAAEPRFARQRADEEGADEEGADDESEEWHEADQKAAKSRKRSTGKAGTSK